MHGVHYCVTMIPLLLTMIFISMHRPLVPIKSPIVCPRTTVLFDRLESHNIYCTQMWPYVLGNHQLCVRLECHRQHKSKLVKLFVKIVAVLPQLSALQNHESKQYLVPL